MTSINTEKSRFSKYPSPITLRLSQILAMLGASRIGNNLNQLAKAANSGALMADEEVIEQIEEAYAFHLAIRSMLMEALGLKADSNDKHPSDQ